MKNLKYFKKSIMVIMILILTFSMTISIFASEEQNDIDKTLEAIGFPKDIINEQLSMSEKTEIYNDYISSPEASSISTTTYEVDTLYELDIFVNTSKEDLLSAGVTTEEIQQTEAEIAQLNDMSNDELMEEFDTDAATVKLIREALEPDKDFSIKPGDYEVTASGSITSSEMSFTQYVTNYSTSSRAKYYVRTYFNWSSAYILGCFDDIVCTAWGGNLTHSSYSRVIAYYATNVSPWGPFVTNRTPSMTELVINGSKQYSFPQNYGAGKAKSGAIRYYLTQNSYSGLSTKVISQYGHKVFTFGGGVSVSISGPSVSLSIGTKYDKSAQLQNVIYY